MDGANLFRSVADLSNKGLHREALELLRQQMRVRNLEAEEVERAGRIIREGLRNLPYERRLLRCALLGQCTTSWLAPSLVAVAWGHNAAVDVTEGQYDGVLQVLAGIERGPNVPDVTILFPWHQRLLSEHGSRSNEERIGDELHFWRGAWDHVTSRMGSRLLQVGYDWIVPGPEGHHLSGATDGTVELVREMNSALRKNLPPGSFFLDLELIAGEFGRNAFYDLRQYYLTKQPMSMSGLLWLAENIWAGVRALAFGPKRVLVVDLDNTLWGGLVGEVGPLGIELGETPDGEAFSAFQKYLKGLSARGVLLAVVSKNNPEDAKVPFETNPNMVLSLGDFADFSAGWESKTKAVQRLAAHLNLGLDNFVFFDDSLLEREEIRHTLPDVEVIDVPSDPAEYVRVLQKGLWFESLPPNDADFQRSVQYQHEKNRRESQSQGGTTESYLESLQMRGKVGQLDPADLPRVVQLIGKTNQFNLTSRRHSMEEVSRLVAEPGSIGLTLRVSDRFGDYGLVSTLLAEAVATDSGPALRIDTWVMSCRAISRTIEQFFFNAFVLHARGLGYQTLQGEFIPTGKNDLVAPLYESLGFHREADSGDGGTLFSLSIKESVEAKTSVWPEA